jgi:hypothetical protein
MLRLQQILQNAVRWFNAFPLQRVGVDRHGRTFETLDHAMGNPAPLMCILAHPSAQLALVKNDPPVNMAAAVTQKTTP